MDFLYSPEFWIALAGIIWVNIILSGDNAVVIALAARSLPGHQQKKAIFWGAGAAVLLRVVLTIVAARLLALPFLKLAGGVALLWIAVQLLIPEFGGDEDVTASSNLAGAIKTILIADLVMSVDNVLAVAAAAKGSNVLLILGLLISVPLVVFGASMLMGLMKRFPIIITLGAAILGWTAGEMEVSDPSIVEWVDANAHWLHWAAPVFGAVAVVAVGTWLAKRKIKHVQVAEHETA
jgi:YjbE family integral membrane protein